METLREDWTELPARVRGFVGRRVNEPNAADDITQDVLLKVHQRLAELPSDEKLPAWVFAVARNALTDHFRARAVREHADVAELPPAVTDRSEEEDQRDAVSGLATCLKRMVEHLPEPYREAMRLADIEGLPQQEIADRAGISLSGAKSRVQRARQQLREMILDCCKVEQDGRGNVIAYETTERSGRYCGNGKPQCGH